MLAMVLVFGMALVGCDDGSTDDDGGSGRGKDLKYSIRVNNQAGQSQQQSSVARTVSAGDTVELYILNFEYCEDDNARAMILIAHDDRDTGSKHTILNNAGWYSVDAELAVENDVNNGPYSGFQIKISQLRVGGEDGTVYDFPEEGVLFGNPTSIWVFGQNLIYQDNFSGVTITDSTVSLKTVLTVEPGILRDAEEDDEEDGYDENGLAIDPYRYIKIEGRVNE
jgi:hypothetical protein